MHTSARLLSEHVRKPLISFVGKRKWPATPNPQRPHPAAPAQYQASFSEFLKKYESSANETSHSGNAKLVYGEFWEAPSWVWQPRIRKIEDSEIDAILSGGASVFR
ncbi:hypothetical protein HETIRDRAFT_124128 [Heterobasidion irregulare TC 32-1]|uniref:Uncharacterized protein n=1 Tax=Heterobasidion irregulare (strain TC 32-1) TaxID=747525 RepID=W4KFG8_HETIT|nr:uncharacterized protein HETIRDRAFT_124128 [Heterobasidion irregulare TC 32-1]ETW84607.1 hypothetical protein HETIRDRAFT_124128 [Heterobasidion irregulare TC 32-1]